MYLYLFFYMCIISYITIPTSLLPFIPLSHPRIYISHKQVILYATEAGPICNAQFLCQHTTTFISETYTEIFISRPLELKLKWIFRSSPQSWPRCGPGLTDDLRAMCILESSLCFTVNCAIYFSSALSKVNKVERNGKYSRSLSVYVHFCLYLLVRGDLNSSDEGKNVYNNVRKLFSAKNPTAVENFPSQGENGATYLLFLFKHNTFKLSEIGFVCLFHFIIR